MMECECAKRRALLLWIEKGRVQRKETELEQLSVHRRVKDGAQSGLRLTDLMHVKMSKYMHAQRKPLHESL